MVRETIRVSELALWLRCRRRTYLQYEMGYDSTSREAGVGSAFHALVAGYYDPTRILDEALYNELDPDSRVMVDNMFHTYVTEVEADGLDVGNETLLVEERMYLETGGLTLTGQVDRIYLDNITGEIVIQDTKTVGQVFETAQRDFQLMAYLVMVAEMFPAIGYAIEHNIVKRNKRTARSKPPYVQRNRIHVSAEEVEKWKDVLAYIVLDYKNAMQMAENSGDGVHSPVLWAKGQNDCSWYCPFSDICGMVDDPEADVSGVLEAEYVKREEEPLYA